MARFRLIVLAALLVAGCEVFFGIEQSPSGSGGAAACPGADAGNPDAHFCDIYADHYLCADFDEKSIALNWTNPDFDTGAHIQAVLDPCHSTSAPASFGVTSVSASMLSSSCESSRLVKEFAGTATGVHLAFDFLGCGSPVLATGVDTDFIQINCTLDGPGSPPQFGMIKWALRSSGYVLEATAPNAALNGGGTPEIFTTETPSSVRFTRVEIDAVFGTSDTPGSVLITFDRADAGGSSTATFWCPVTSAMHKLALTMGIYGCNALPDCAVNFDNVVFDFTD